MRPIAGLPGLLAAGGALLLAAGCSQGGESPAAAVTAASLPPPVSSSVAPVSPSAAPSPEITTPRSTAPETTQAPVSGDGGCGTVRAASGLTLRVEDSSTAGMDCAQATDLVARFQRQLTGKQGPDSRDPVSATVDGWLCVSGPPSAQGGTTCSKQDLTVFAGVAAGE